MSETSHRISVADGESVAAVHHAAADDDGSDGDGRGWIVFCHGFLSDKTGSYEHRCQRAVREGYDAVRFDFRGCGESDGQFVDQTIGDKLADLRAVIEYFDPPALVLFGSSFGGKVAFHAAVDESRVEAVATRAPVTYNRTFDEYRSVVAETGELVFDTGVCIDERFFEAFDAYPFADVAASLSVPVAIFHGRDDDSVPIADSLEAASALETDVLLEAFAGEGHLFSASAEARLLERLFHWLEE
ncbi:alpha/beta hydrolase family protein [Natronolimnohabitans innermongolicus]|uniref:Alpha/beta hydrolase fold protein n=1 Tax=Natronolimnohabitans innermongolicus JCM 12255 TaxID=1227499 RepID=L9WHD2_9EURY|nr:alpha/beta fold hydrolase [Natronolimnohabitans innermongolicus]ELY48915.1 alpha/beta hydrolase fold protein [Natronolimnohabitans innermongolicus JCM 12255]